MWKKRMMGPRIIYRIINLIDAISEPALISLILLVPFKIAPF